jgi:hypothetical protein
MAVLDSTLNQYEVLNYFNYKDGNLYKRFKENKPVGSFTDEGYVVVGFNKKSQFAHRVIFLMFNGYLPNCIDHIDGNRANNRIENLRPANANTNAYNQAPRKNTASNLKNVTWHKVSKKWQVKMAVNGHIKYFGLYNDIEYAKFVAETMRHKYHGSFARG